MANQFFDKANFIWQIADDIPRGAFKVHEYGDVTLPSVGLRRLDCVSEFPGGLQGGVRAIQGGSGAFYQLEDVLLDVADELTFLKFPITT